MNGSSKKPNARFMGIDQCTASLFPVGRCWLVVMRSAAQPPTAVSALTENQMGKEAKTQKTSAQHSGSFTARHNGSFKILSPV